jgi:hypothetical protein
MELCPRFSTTPFARGSIAFGTGLSLPSTRQPRKRSSGQLIYRAVLLFPAGLTPSPTAKQSLEMLFLSIVALENCVFEMAIAFDVLTVSQWTMLSIAFPVLQICLSAASFLRSSVLVRFGGLPAEAAGALSPAFRVLPVGRPFAALSGVSDPGLSRGRQARTASTLSPIRRCGVTWFQTSS